jgi:hypothetical protein
MAAPGTLPEALVFIQALQTEATRKPIPNYKGTPFDGRTPPIHDFLFSLDRSCLRVRIDSNDVKSKAHLSTTLVGEALTWYRTHLDAGHLNNTYTQICTALRDRFLDRAETLRSLNRLYTLRQTGSNVVAFNRIFLDIIAHITGNQHPVEAELLRIYRTALK